MNKGFMRSLVWEGAAAVDAASSAFVFTCDDAFTDEDNGPFAHDDDAFTSDRAGGGGAPARTRRWGGSSLISTDFDPAESG
jgi:hypothetical protein